MTADPDPYAVLGLTHAATQAEITRAYRILLRRHHPDTRAHGQPSKASDEALQLVLAAYAVLGDPARRFDFDRGSASSQRRQAQAPGSGQPVISVRPAGHGAAAPIQVGPVHWHRGAPPAAPLDLQELLDRLTAGWRWEPP